MRFAFVILLFAATSAIAETQIHRCLLADGTYSFQEMSCAEPITDDDEGDIDESDCDTTASPDDAFDVANPFDEPETPPAQAEPALPEPVSQNRAECEKTTRDAIDAIDVRMRESTYSREQGRAYLEELRALTQQLRACKQL